MRLGHKLHVAPASSLQALIPSDLRPALAACARAVSLTCNSGIARPAQVKFATDEGVYSRVGQIEECKQHSLAGDERDLRLFGVQATGEKRGVQFGALPPCQGQRQFAGFGNCFCPTLLCQFGFSGIPLSSN